MFHDCARVKEFSDSDPKIQYLKDHWYKIENNDGNFEFNLTNGKVPSQNETIKTVNYDTNLMELCREHIAHGWKSYVKINKKEFNSKGYLFAVVGEDGRCEMVLVPHKNTHLMIVLIGRKKITSLELVNSMLEGKK